MDTSKSNTAPPKRLTPSHDTDREDWEAWEDEEPVTDLDKEGESLTNSGDNGFKGTKRQLERLKSRRRQKAQNAEAGITLVTDMSKFRRTTTSKKQTNTTRFQDSAALRALEGSPNSASIGSFAWLKPKPASQKSNNNNSNNSKSAKKTTTTTSRGTETDLSPVARPIVIGLSVPEGDLSSHEVSPQTALVETPIDMRNYINQAASKKANNGNGSMMSPEQLLANPEDDDTGTPCTLFEEDGSPMGVRKSFKPRAVAATPQSADTQVSGWWDHVGTPYAQSNPFRTQPTGPSPLASSPQEWWQGVDEKRQQATATGAASNVASHPAFLRPQDTAQTVYTAQRQQSGTPTEAGPSNRQETHSEKARILFEENQVASDQPPPYSPPPNTNKQVKYGPILPPQGFYSPQPIPSPGPLSPGIPGTMSSQGAINMSEIPVTPRMVPAAVLPDRPVGTFVPGHQFQNASGTRHKTERNRRRHEKEDIVARRRRRVYLGICGGILAVIILIIVLVVVLTRKRSPSGPEQSIWLNLTDFPPMPTGVLTVAGADTPVVTDGCVELTASTAWSCAVPKDQQDPRNPNPSEVPEFIFQIQYDNSSRRRDVGKYDFGFNPNPAPPSLREMSFLGNTTDEIQSDNKAGEPTPFYISLLPSLEATVGPNMTQDDSAGNNGRRDLGSGIDTAPINGTSGWNLTNVLPPPETNSDGTGAKARLYPLATQQPLRLYDRGLPTEHYGFYTYFNKTVYLFNTAETTPTDRGGGARLADARFLVTWTEVRFVVQMWTRMGNSSRLIGNGTAPGKEGTTVHARPGTMPYPVTIAEDLHGGNPFRKATFYYGMDQQSRVNRTDSKLILVNRGFGGALVNDLSKQPDLSLGGVDGGTGGCRCEWVNWQGKKSAQRTKEQLY
ncbi:glycoprotease family protein [Apiospora aurea]|uniref:Glycoprotease family protein n=1 Tax=Apiospora aurea TaxID=335848 RepID=A0ABR1PVX3_9PEZI